METLMNTSANKRTQSSTYGTYGSAKYGNEKWDNEANKNNQRLEFKWRTAAATFWAMVLMILPLVMFIFISKIKIFGVFGSIFDAIGQIFSLQFIGYLIALQILCLPNALIIYKCSQVCVLPFNTKWNEIMHVCYPRQLVWVLLMAILGLLYAALFTNAINSIIIVDYCKNDAACSLSTTTSLLAFGSLQGFIHGMFYFTRKGYVLTFPVIQERKFFRIKDSLPLCFKSAIYGTTESIKFFFLLHIAIEILLYVMIFLISGRSLSLYVIPNTLAILNLSFLWICATLGVAILMSLKINEYICKIFLTQEYSFILKSDFIQDHRLLLQSSLLSSDKLLQHLAFMDLCNIGKFDSKRRKQIFEITVPGGHPENWNLVLNQCLLVIEESTSRFHRANEEEMKISQAKANDMPCKHRVVAARKGCQDSSSSNTLLQSLSETTGKPLHSYPSNDWNSTEEVASDKTHDQQSSYQSRLKKATPLKDYSILSTWFYERIEFKSESLFQDYQLVIWTLEALSSLVSASYHEDTYGIVQRTLPQILVALLSFLETVERYLKNSVKDERALTRKITEFKKRKVSSNNASSYKIAIQTSIYKITTQFGSNLESVRIPREFRKRLDSFVEFRD